MTCTTCGAPCLACSQKANADAKAKFLKRYKATLGRVAKRLGLRAGEYRVWTNEGGVAVMGDVYLEASRGESGLHVCVSGYHFADDPPRFFYRSTRPEGDRVVHGDNRWLLLTALDEDAVEAVDAFRSILDGVSS